MINFIIVNGAEEGEALFNWVVLINHSNVKINNGAITECLVNPLELTYVSKILDFIVNG